MLSCKEIVKLLSSDGSGEEIPLMTKAQLRMHLVMCKHCGRYAKHLQMLSDGFKKLFRERTRVDPAQVDQVEKEAITVVEKSKPG